MQLQMRTKEFKIVELKVEEGVNLGSKINDFFILNMVSQKGTLLSFNFV